MTLKARTYAFTLLKFRPRSEYEIRTRLKKKNFDAKVIQEVVTFLQEKKFIDDAQFASAWITSRLKKPLGLRRIAQELREKGIAPAIIARATDIARQHYSEAEVLTQLALQKFKRFNTSNPESAKRRLFGYLLRRGFSQEAVREVMEQL